LRESRLQLRKVEATLVGLADPVNQKRLKEIRAELEKTEHEFEENRQLLKEKEDAWHAEENVRRSSYEKTYFIIADGIGLGALIIGAIVPMASIGTGFILGGMTSLASGYYAYWGHLPNMIKLGSLILALLIILGLSYRFFYRKTE